MLSEVTVYSPQLETEPYTLVRPGSADNDLIQIREIAGLGPVTANINTSKSGNVDREVFLSANLGSRNIVLTLGPNPDWETSTYESLRLLLSKTFMPESKVRMTFSDTERETVEISGYVESFEPNMFAQNPEYQVSIICPESDFVGEEVQILTLPVHLGVVYVSSERLDIEYEGTRPTGLELRIPVLPSGSSIHVVDMSIFHKYSGFTSGLFVDNMSVGEDQGLILSTVVGDKYAKTLHASSTPQTSVMQKVATSSQWIQLKTGLNSLRVGYTLSNVVGYANSISPDTFDDAELYYRNRYGSI